MLVLQHLKSFIPSSLDPYQFAYRSKRSVEDAIAVCVHENLQHLEKRNSYSRILFIDYSSAFNTIVPLKLYNKLLGMMLFPTSICNWIFDFLTHRRQFVRVGSIRSTTITINTGTPQGCVLSPMLYSLFTHDCVSAESNCIVLKFADDTTVSGLILNGDERAYRAQVD